MNLEQIRTFLTDRRRVIKYLFVGGLGFLVDNTVIYFLVDIASIKVTFSKIVSAEAAIISNFLINDLWTFSEHKPDSRITRFLKSNSIRVLGVIIALLVLKILYEGFGINLLIANSIGIFVGFTSNYILESIYTWKTHEKIE